MVTLRTTSFNNQKFYEYILSAVREVHLVLGDGLLYNSTTERISIKFDIIDVQNARNKM